MKSKKRTSSKGRNRGEITLIPSLEEGQPEDFAESVTMQDLKLSPPLYKRISKKRSPCVVDVNVSGKVLEILCVYLRHRNGRHPAQIKAPVQATRMNKIVDKFDAAYVDHLFNKRATFYEVLAAAHSLKIDPLLDLCSAKIASVIKGRTPTEMASLLQP